ncbi:MAG: hypothetical protein C5B43_01700 [Verrucomicrobia bacterium]|nr:MAG: hypothetical protein C5B43_01700 [Verrucomicrobiota bacterium]
MNNYYKGIIVLAIIIVGILFIGIQSFKSLDLTKNLLNELRNKNESDKTHYEGIKRELLVNDQTIKKIEEFSRTWEPFLKSASDTNKILSDLIALAFKNSLIISEKFSERKRNSDQDAFKEIIVINLKVTGTFARIYSWLGTVEEAYPQAKINNLELLSENMNAALILGLVIPIILI